MAAKPPISMPNHTTCAAISSARPAAAGAVPLLIAETHGRPLDALFEGGDWTTILGGAALLSLAFTALAAGVMWVLDVF